MGGVQPGMMGDEMMDEYGDEGEEDSSDVDALSGFFANP